MAAIKGIFTVASSFVLFVFFDDTSIGNFEVAFRKLSTNFKSLMMNILPLPPRDLVIQGHNGAIRAIHAVPSRLVSWPL